MPDKIQRIEPLYTKNDIISVKKITPEFLHKEADMLIKHGKYKLALKSLYKILPLQNNALDKKTATKISICYFLIAAKKYQQKNYWGAVENSLAAIRFNRFAKAKDIQITAVLSDIYLDINSQEISNKDFKLLFNDATLAKIPKKDFTQDDPDKVKMERFNFRARFRLRDVTTKAFKELGSDNNFWHFFKAGHINSTAGNYKKALRYYSKAIKLNPKSAAAYLNRAFVYKYMSEMMINAHIKKDLEAKSKADSTKAYALTKNKTKYKLYLQMLTKN